MKKWIFILICLLAFAAWAVADAYRATSEDLYQESYRATMRRQTGSTAAEQRADEYRARYELCDEHHNCINETAIGRTPEGQMPSPEADKKHELIKPYLHMPIWQ